MKRSLQLISLAGLITIILLTCTARTATAQKIDFKTVQTAALYAFSYYSNSDARALTVKEVLTESNGENAYYYVFNFSPTGFVIMSDDYKFTPVLGVSNTTTFNPKTVPPALQFLLDEFKSHMDIANSGNFNLSSDSKSEWDFYINYPAHASERTYVPGNYLMSTIWDQNGGYNQAIPSPAGSGCKPYVGCVGVAIGQILKYWGCHVFPDSVMNYTPYGYSTPINVKYYQQNYNWDAMSNTVADNDNSTLLYHAAASAMTQFSCTSGSGSADFLASRAFVYFWGFTHGGLQAKASFNLPVWIDKLKADIDAGRPINYFGTTTTNAGHSWVIDGYDGITFHCNWGYGGDYNGFFPLACLDPGPMLPDFSSNQKAILNIRPILNSCTDFVGDNVICSSPTSYSISIPSNASVCWSCSPNLKVLNGYYDPGMFYLLALYPNSSSSGYVKVEVYNSHHILFRSMTRYIWVGKPSFYLVNQPTVPVNSFGTSTVIYTTTTNQGILNYAWSRSGAIAQITYSTQPVAVFKTSTSPGIGTISSTQSNTCGTYTASSTITVVANLAIYPNPANSLLNIEMIEDAESEIPAENILEIQLFDLMMNQKKSTRLNGSSTSIDVSDLDPNVYIIRVITDSNVYDEKIIVNRD